MNIINVTVRGKIARAEGRARVVCGNSDYAVRFDFDAEWAEYDLKTARFVSEDGSYTDVQFEGDDCAVPILRNTRTLLVGVFAGNLRTTTAALIHAVPCITDPDGTPADPQPDVYAQLMERFNAMELPEYSDADTGKVLTIAGDAGAQWQLPSVRPEYKTSAMTSPVGVDADGKLWSKANTSLNITGATVGQIAKITAVDDSGKPTAWEAVDMPSGEEKEWKKIIDVEITEATGSFDRNDLVEVTELYIKWSNLKNATATNSGHSLVINGTTVISNKATIIKAEGAGTTNGWTHCKYNGLFWEVRMSPGALVTTNTTVCTLSSVYNNVENVGTAHQIKLYNVAPYFAVSGKLEVWAR